MNEKIEEIEWRIKRIIWRLRVIGIAQIIAGTGLCTIGFTQAYTPMAGIGIFSGIGVSMLGIYFLIT